MDLTNYTSDFHDGGLIDIKHTDNNIELSISSAEMDPEDIHENISLGYGNRIRGILHFECVHNILIDEKLFTNKLEMKSQFGTIFDLQIKNNTVEIQIIWKTFIPKFDEVGFSTIVIEAEKIYWENIPNLVDPHW